MEDLAVTDREAVTRAAILGRRRPTVHVTAAVEAATTTTHRPTAKTAWLGETSTRETIPLGGASLESVEDFPSLCGSAAPSAPAAPPLQAGWTASSALARRAPAAQLAHTVEARPEEFPELGAAGAAGAAAAVAAAARTAVVAAGVDRACLAGGPTRTAPSP